MKVTPLSLLGVELKELYWFSAVIKRNRSLLRTGKITPFIESKPKEDEKNAEDSTGVVVQITLKKELFEFTLGMSATNDKKVLNYYACY